MKNLVILFFVVLGFISCQYKSGSGNIITETRKSENFKAISISGGFEVELRQAPEVEVVVEADDNLMEYIETKVRKEELVIRLDDLNVHDAHLKVFIAAPSVNALKTSAGAEIVVKDMLKSGNVVRLKASSGSQIKTSVDAPEVRADASSAGNIEISGRTRDFYAETSSGSPISAGELLSENTEAGASSGSTAKVHASVKLHAKASSGASISYRGSAVVSKETSSGGSVEKE